MPQHEVVYLGGPKHGERWARPGDIFDASREIVIPGQYEDYLYRLDPLFDIPGALAYIYEPAKGDR